MVVADPEATLLTVCARTATENGLTSAPTRPDDGEAGPDDDDSAAPQPPVIEPRTAAEKALRDIRTSERNGKVIGIARVTDEDEIFMMTAKGKIQRIKAADISVIGRNTRKAFVS